MPQTFIHCAALPTKSTQASLQVSALALLIFIAARNPFRVRPLSWSAAALLAILSGLAAPGILTRLQHESACTPSPHDDTVDWCMNARHTQVPMPICGVHKTLNPARTGSDSPRALRSMQTPAALAPAPSVEWGSDWMTKSSKTCCID